MAGVRADLGTLNEARMLAARRLELACRSDYLRVIAQAKADLAALLLSIGRWRDVAREVGDPISGDAFPLEMRRAGLDLAAGRPLEALARLEKGMNGNALPGRPSSRGAVGALRCSTRCGRRRACGTCGR